MNDHLQILLSIHVAELHVPLRVAVPDLHFAAAIHEVPLLHVERMVVGSIRRTG